MATVQSARAQAQAAVALFLAALRGRRRVGSRSLLLLLPAAEQAEGCDFVTFRRSVQTLRLGRSVGRSVGRLIGLIRVIRKFAMKINKNQGFKGIYM